MKSDLDDTYRRYQEALHDLDPALQEDLHRYICIRFSGYLERLLYEAVHGYLGDSRDEAVRNFGASFFKKAPNLNPEALGSLVGRFGQTWSAEIKDFLDIEPRRNSLGRMIDIRNKTAHGEDYGGSRLNVATYKDLVDDLHSWITERLLS
ncbi:HEPN domain-containing protein [Actinoplanes sp. TFC3]|uniref:HEPN domain-containing protein n=1 Tax=Actinoplanes sp. TFC3 TaxID=1710355 RepID=UPI00128FEDCF|nr:HEPN domain-containing protein [Actinoplanes sp. TFC3]